MTTIQAKKGGFVPKFSVEDRRRTLSIRLAEIVSADKSMIKMHERTIENFESRGGGDVEYNEQRILRCQSQIEFLLERVATTERKISGVAMGESDAEISSSYCESRDLLRKKVENDKKRKILEAEQELNTYTEGSLYYKSEMSENRKERAMDRELKKFWSCVETLPPHIAKNIETTPCNRAYRWRGVLFYGKLPEQLPDMIFDKKDGGTLIREMTRTSDITYHKDQSKQKRVVASFRRQVRDGLSGPAIMTRC